MSLSKKLFYFLLMSLVFNLPGYASELDDECETFCSNNGYEDGQYLAPEADAKCNDGYEQNKENQICCCKPKIQT